MELMMARKVWLRKMVRAGLSFLFRVLTRMEFSGTEHIPAEGGALLAINHLGIMDAPLVFIHLDRLDVTGLVADKHKTNPFLSFLVNVVDGIWINRESADLSALKEALDFLRRGGMLGIAPEGTRSRSGVLQQAKTGVAYLADKAQVPVIPVAVYGTEKAFAQMLHLRRPRVVGQVGEPFTLPPLERRDREASMRRNVDEIMCRIAVMLPEKYWGAYAGHPRLQELLVEKARQATAE